MKRLIIGTAAFALGSVTAAGFSVANRPSGSANASPAPIRALRPTADRIGVDDKSVRTALAQGTIDQPIKTILNVPAKLSYGEYRWNDANVPHGPVWIRVDLRSQLVSVFRAGHEIGTAVILYGGDGVATPTGTFPILAKFKDHRSATYDAAMPDTLRLTRDGVSIHASNVRWGYATHGCIGVPEAFAARLFTAASVGDHVLIVNPPSRARA